MVGRFILLCKKLSGMARAFEAFIIPENIVYSYNLEVSMASLTDLTCI